MQVQPVQGTSSMEFPTLLGKVQSQHPAVGQIASRTWSYLIHDNYGRPFRVEICPQEAVADAVYHSQLCSPLGARGPAHVKIYIYRDVAQEPEEKAELEAVEDEFRKQQNEEQEHESQGENEEEVSLSDHVLNVQLSQITCPCRECQTPLTASQLELVDYFRRQEVEQARRLELCPHEPKPQFELTSEQKAGTQPILEFKTNHVFAGSSPVCEMTLFSGGHGPKFDGNTILFQENNDLDYIFVGGSIVRFRAQTPLEHFFSPVGNNDVPYSYARDANGSWYLLTEGVQMQWNPAETGVQMQWNPAETKANENVENPEDESQPQYVNVFEHFYEQCKMTGFRNIKNWIVWNEHDADQSEAEGHRYEFRYNTHPRQYFKRVLWDVPSSSKVLYQDGSLEELSLEQYCQLIEDFGAERGFRPIQNHTHLIERFQFIRE